MVDFLVLDSIFVKVSCLLQLFLLTLTSPRSELSEVSHRGLSIFPQENIVFYRLCIFAHF